MNENIINIFQGSGSLWDFSLDGSYRPAPGSRGYRSQSEATEAGITAALVKGLVIAGATGRVDRKLCRERGIKYIDPRKGHDGRRSQASVERQRVRLQEKIAGVRPFGTAKEEWKTCPQPQPAPAPLSSRRMGAIAKAQAARRAAIEEERAQRVCPEGFRSLDHFLDSLSEATGRVYGGRAELARYLKTNTKSVSRWLGHQRQYPLQETIDAMALWYANAVRKGKGL